MNLVNRVFLYCRMRGISIPELSRRTGLSRQTIYRMNNTGKCTVENIEKLCETIDLEINFRKIEKKVDKTIEKNKVVKDFTLTVTRR